MKVKMKIKKLEIAFTFLILSLISIQLLIKMEQMIKDSPTSSSISTLNNNDYLNFRKEIGIMSTYLIKFWEYCF